MLNFTFKGNGFQWLDYINPTKEELQELQITYGLHALAIDHFLVTRIQRPKIIHFESAFFYLDNFISYNEESSSVEIQDAGYFVGSNFLISLHRHPAPLLQTVLHQIGSEPENELSVGRIFYLILDETIDEQFAVMNSIDRSIDRLEQTILSENHQSIAAAFFKIKKNLLRIKRILSPRRDALTKLVRFYDRYLGESHQIYFLDVFDHALRAFETVQTQIDTLNGILELYLTTLSNHTNEIVKMLTLAATLAVPVTVISTVYGMNFKSIPEFDWRYGYLYFWVLAIGTTFGLYRYLKRRKWL
jgi:magnesium transporter